MQIELIKLMPRFAVVKINNDGFYENSSQAEIFINDRFYKKTSLVINYIDKIKPGEDITLTVRFNDVEESISFTVPMEFVTLNVKKFGAVGDGVNDDTVYFQSAVMACPKNSRIFVPKGIYKIRNIFLKSNITIELSEGAVLLADNERYNHPVFPGMIESYDGKSEYNLGTWEGNPLPMFAGIITGLDVENVTICGKGVIDGNASHDDWWYDEKTMRGAFRPRLLFLSSCENIFVCGVTFRNSPSWTIHPYFSEDITFAGINIQNPSDSPNTDGIDVESCKNVNITGVKFTLGDDCIALKSCKIYMGRKYGLPSENIDISHCLMENGHGAVTVGSEMSAGVRNVKVSSCIFSNTDRGLRIKTRRGRGDKAVIDNITFSHINMNSVKTPFVVNCFYFCDPDGRTSYVQNRDPLPVDERTPSVKELCFEDINCTDTHFAVAYFHGLPERKIEKISMKNIYVDFDKNALKGYPAMLCGVEEMCKRGIYADNIEKLLLENVTVKGYNGDKYELYNIDDFMED